MEFCAIESCGKCTPCRIGSTRGAEVIDRISQSMRTGDRETAMGLLRDLCDTMTYGSLCALGGLTPLPVMSALRHFPEDFGLSRSDVHGRSERAKLNQLVEVARRAEIGFSRLAGLPSRGAAASRGD